MTDRDSCQTKGHTDTHRMQMGSEIHIFNTEKSEKSSRSNKLFELQQIDYLQCHNKGGLKSVHWILLK